MTALEIILLAIRWAHALAAVVWIGGSLFLLLAGRPALRSPKLRSIDPDGLLGRALAAEFRPIVATAIAVLIVSGVILSVHRLTSDAAGAPYAIALAIKILLALYAFAIAWLLPRQPARPTAGPAARGIRRALAGPKTLTLIGIVVIGLADVLAWLFERGLAG